MVATMVFLLGGIVSTVLWQGGIPGVGGMTASVFEAAPEPSSYEVLTTEEAFPAREDRIASLRKKIAALGIEEDATPTASETSPDESPLPEVEAGEEATVVVDTCVTYHDSTVAWNPRGLLIEEVEGARLVYREVAGAPVGSSSVPVMTKDIVLQLPVRSVPNSNPSCIRTDVIGIATDGSLIRNDEVGAYGVFGGSTLVGYALDGFPIYGASGGKTDVCGGAMVGGQYRYVVSKERQTIINCFAGVPVNL